MSDADEPLTPPLQDGALHRFGSPPPAVSPRLEEVPRCTTTVGAGRIPYALMHLSKVLVPTPPLARTAACPPLTSVQPPELGIFYERASMHGKPNPSAGSVNLRNSRGCRQAGTQINQSQSSKRPERGTLQFHPRRQKYHVAPGSILVRQHRD